ncbi:TfoX/Sxy family protein [Aliiroseovarius sp. F47248L]|uniref:TfoX/Sxy family protein n=1 Tax=Aliiroseovarius sp. F47248L TaxID=2926420 RepID=UPI001FF19847|nr:TfoX/Sxy family protein [Aliiroseovarius sp. F47248L]MCK0138938.1 TfoX/Sxy family protein [Aliiroseovarius sp. F47248L]
MTDPVSSIRNLGPASDAGFARAGIHSADELRELGADEAYRRLLAAGSRPHFIGYYAMVMGLQGRPWNDCKGKEKIELRARFNAIKAETRANTPLEDKMEAILNEIGLPRQSDI